MKKITFSLMAIGLVLLGCSPDATLDPVEENIVVNLKTFIPDLSFDQSSKGKYVGVFGHHTNLDIHGKIYINNAQHGQYNALVQLVNGDELKFKGFPRNKDSSQLFFEGPSGTFVADLKDYTKPLFTNVVLEGEQTEGYIVAKKATSLFTPVVLTGFYRDSDNNDFRGNWDIIGDGVDIATVTPGFGTLMRQNVDQIVVTHLGSTNPFVRTLQSYNSCPMFDNLLGLGGNTTPYVIDDDINIPPNPLTPIKVSQAGVQITTFGGIETTWSLSTFFAVNSRPYVDCANPNTPVFTGLWSRGDRSGVIVLD